MIKKRHVMGYGQEVMAICADKRKTRLSLDRTKILIEMTQDKGSQLSSSHWTLSAMGFPPGQWQIEWCEDEKRSYFHVKSYSGDSFLHNGLECFSSVLCRGDYIDFGLHRFYFIDQDSDPDHERDNLPWNHWPGHVNILLSGETGTGKSSMAKKIHRQLHNERKPFVHINLSAFSEHLLESELFGHEKGAFTGADKMKRGAIELAADGTLFIDEIDSVSKDLQLKLLLFLDNHTYRRVGGECELKSYCRLIFASGRRLDQCLKEKIIRPDFYFRMSSGFSHHLKPLREKKEYVEAFVKEYLHKEGLMMSKELFDHLKTCPWPGNYRQLKAYLDKKTLLEERSGFLTFGHLEEELQDYLEVFDQDDNVLPLKVMKKEYCRSAYFKSKGSISETARRLGIARNTLKSILAS